MEAKKTKKAYKMPLNHHKYRHVNDSLLGFSPLRNLKSLENNTTALTSKFAISLSKIW